AGVAELSCRPLGSVSPTAMPDCAGAVPGFVSAKTSVVVPVSAMLAAPKVLPTLGVPAVTTRQRSSATLEALVAVTEAARLVNAAGLPAQLALVCVAVLVRPLTVTVQLAVPAVIAIPESPESTCVPAL